LHLSSDFSTVFAEDINSNALPLIPQSKLNTSINAEFDSDKKISIHRIYLQHIYKFKQARIGLFETETNEYNLVNLGFNLRIKTKGNSIEVDTGVKNLLNKNYIDHLSRFKMASIPNQGINYYMSLKMNLHY
jgi:iron complex outermembrane receptor protein